MKLLALVSLVEGVSKKFSIPKIVFSKKIHIFLSKQAYIKGLLPITYEFVILPIFGKDGETFVDFLSKANFWSRTHFYGITSNED